MSLIPAPDKYETLKKFLEDDYVLVHLNPRFEGVVLPEKHNKTPTLTLKLSFNFQGLVELSKKEITARLVF